MNAPRKLRLILIVAGITLALGGLLAQRFLSGLRYKATIARSRLALQQVADASRQYFAVFGEWPGSLSNLTEPNNPRRIVFLPPFPFGEGDTWEQEVVYVPFDAARGWGVARGHPVTRNGTQMVQEVKFSP